MNKTTKEDIALFRYNQIYPLLKKEYTEASQQGYLENFSTRPINFPDGSTRHIRPGTLKDWLRNYRLYGFDGLKPKARIDSGVGRSLTADQKVEALRLKQENPRRTAASIRRTMIRAGFFSSGSCSESTFQRFFRQNKECIQQPREDRRAFEMAHIHQLWQIDTSHGPFLTIDQKKVKTYIIAIVDDASRFVVGSAIYFEDNGLNVQQTLKKAIDTYGVPQRLYTDNGKPYRNRQLELICANLGIGLNHAAPYHGNAKGKVERFFGVMKTNWMYNINYSDFQSLEELNASLASYVQEKNHTFHRSIQQTPFERMTHDDTPIHRVNKEKLEKAFLHTMTRRVANDGTLKLNNRTFEAGYLCIGLTITIRYLPDLSKVYHETDEQQLLPLKEVNKIENARIKRTQIRLTEE